LPKIYCLLGARKRDRTRILTDTPDKNELVAEPQRKVLKTSNLPSNKKKAKTPHKQEERTSSEGEEEFLWEVEDSNESFNNDSEPQDELI
jgi:hypothetical protein